LKNLGVRTITMNIPREILPSTPVSTVGFIILLVLFAAMFRRVGNGSATPGAILQVLILSVIWFEQNIKKSVFIKTVLWGRLFWNATTVVAEMCFYWDSFLPKQRVLLFFYAENLV
jgi:hypothetical protein